MRRRLSKTLRTFEAIVDEGGRVQLPRNERLPKARRALITLLDETSTIRVSETALFSETSLAEDWNRPEEDEAWSHLQSEL